MGSRLLGSSVDRLPSRFPVGTRYVIEGRGNGQGRVRISLRRLEFPDGQTIDLPVEKIERAAHRRRRLAGRTRVRK
jgi:hypothetical protein